MLLQKKRRLLAQQAQAAQLQEAQALLALQQGVFPGAGTGASAAGLDAWAAANGGGGSDSFGGAHGLEVLGAQTGLLNILQDEGPPYREGSEAELQGARQRWDGRARRPKLTD